MTRGVLPLLLILLIVTSMLMVVAPNARAQQQEYKIYILQVKEAGSSWVTTERYVAEILLKLREVGFDTSKVKVIDDIEEWGRLIEEAPENVIIINGHGELIPVPTKYGDDWQTFFTDLATLIKDKGWIFINAIGYGFFYIGNTKTSIGLNTGIGEDGLLYLAGELGFMASAWPPKTEDGVEIKTGKMTKLAQKIFAALGLDMPTQVNVPRPITTDYEPLWYFFVVKYKDTVAYGCAAFKFGKGMLVWGGLGESNEDIYARATVAMLMYILDPTLPQKPPKKKGLPPALIAIIAALIALIALGAVYFLKIKKRS